MSMGRAEIICVDKFPDLTDVTKNSWPKNQAEYSTSQRGMGIQFMDRGQFKPSKRTMPVLLFDI